MVIGINGGMPVRGTRWSLRIKGDSSGTLENNPYPKHHLASDDDDLRFLGDVIPVPMPIAQAISLGDLLTYAGVGVVIVGAMRSMPARRENEAPTGTGVAHVGG